VTFYLERGRTREMVDLRSIRGQPFDDRALPARRIDRGQAASAQQQRERSIRRGGGSSSHPPRGTAKLAAPVRTLRLGINPARAGRAPRGVESRIARPRHADASPAPTHQHPASGRQARPSLTDASPEARTCSNRIEERATWQAPGWRGGRRTLRLRRQRRGRPALWRASGFRDRYCAARLPPNTIQTS